MQLLPTSCKCLVCDCKVPPKVTPCSVRAVREQILRAHNLIRYRLGFTIHGSKNMGLCRFDSVFSPNVFNIILGELVMTLLMRRNIIILGELVSRRNW